MTAMLRTYEDYLKERGLPATGDFACTQPGCATVGPAFTIVQQGDKFVCSNCYLADIGAVEQRSITLAKHELDQSGSWETDLGGYLKAQRNMLLDTSLWAIQVDSPLTRACQLQYVQFRKALNRLTVDYPDPQYAVMPEPPENEYESN